MYNEFLDINTNTKINIYDTVEGNSIKKLREFYRINYNDTEIDLDYSTVYGITYIYSTVYKRSIYG
jgi:hypothetical protein